MKRDLQNILVERLLPGPQLVATLTETIATETEMTIQGVYKALRSLRTSAIVTIHNKVVSLSLIWINKEKEKYAFASYSYHANKDLEKKLQADRSKVIFHFRNLSELDLFWTHAYAIIAKKTNSSCPRYMLIPHDFFLYARTETDTFWMKENITKYVTTRLVVTHPFPIDKLAVKKRADFKDNPFDYLLHENPLKQENNIYFNTLGEYIFKGTFDEKINESIESLLSTIKKLPLATTEETRMNELLEQRGRFILTIERNKKKAEIMEKKVRKYFE